MTVTEVLLPNKHTTHITGNVPEDTHGYIELVTEYDCHWSVITNQNTTHITGNDTEDTHGYIVLVTEYDCHWSVITNQTHNTSLAMLLKIPMVTLC